jgi:4-methyl-5(b-hydroxyethyl)-thiazole monophosphate biosynthesis
MKVLVILAEGFEEIEAVTPIDVLRRAGAEVTVAGLTAESVLGSRGISIIPDARLDAVAHEDYDLVVLPGGMPGATNLKNDATVKAVLKKAIEADRTVGAICASPAVVLDSHGFLKNRRATCHPALASEMIEGTLTDDRVTVDGNIITSKGPGTAMEFALTLVAKLYGEEKAAEVNAPMFALPQG